MSYPPKTPVGSVPRRTLARELREKVCEEVPKWPRLCNDNGFLKVYSVKHTQLKEPEQAIEDWFEEYAIVLA